MLEIRDLTLLRNGQRVLDGFSLTLQRGEIAILLGQSGVGKSTLLRVLNGLERQETGSILVDGREAEAEKNSSRPIGLVFQEGELFPHLTVRENIALPLRLVKGMTADEARVTAEELLQRYQLGEKGDRVPGELSGGQRQRLAIARAVSVQPQILCLDEPTSALDPAHTKQIAEEISELSERGLILLITTHDTALLQLLNCQVHLMEAGKLVESTHTSSLTEKSAPKISAFVNYTESSSKADF